MSAVETPAVAVAAVLAGTAVALAVPPSRGRCRAAGLRLRRQGGTGVEPRGREDLLGRHPIALCVLAAGAPALLLGGTLGVLSGLVAAAVVGRWAARREPARERRRREQVGRSLPHAVDLLAVTLAAGAAPSVALRAVAGVLEGPLAEELRAAERALDLGRDPAAVWRALARRPGLSTLGRTMVRAVDTGSSVSEAMQRLAADLHDSSLAELESQARTVGTRAAAPLGLCLLPAFVLVGVVPLVASTVQALLVR